jgi:hypothetical protein
MKVSIKRAAPLLLVGMGLMVAGVAANAAQDTGSVTVTAQVDSKAKLTLGRNTLTFADASPTTTPSVTDAAGAINIDVKARTKQGGAISLMMTGSDLSGTVGGNTITADKVSWSASGDAGFVTSGSSSTSAQSVGSWTDSKDVNANFSFAFANSYLYASDTYTGSLSFTLTSPEGP